MSTQYAIIKLVTSKVTDKASIIGSTLAKGKKPPTKIIDDTGNVTTNPKVEFTGVTADFSTNKVTFDYSAVIYYLDSSDVNVRYRAELYGTIVTDAISGLASVTPTVTEPTDPDALSTVAYNKDTGKFDFVVNYVVNYRQSSDQLVTLDATIV